MVFSFLRGFVIMKETANRIRRSHINLENMIDGKRGHQQVTDDRSDEPWPLRHRGAPHLSAQRPTLTT